MNASDRINAAVRHETPDRVPMHLNASQWVVQRLMDRYSWPDPEWFDFSGIRSDLTIWNNFSIMASGGSVFQHASYLVGVDILDPIQPESMDPANIKKLYGKDICLRGGISSQQVLAHGSSADVEYEVRKKLDDLMPGGGYIFSPGHPVLQVDIPTENIVTMYQTALKYGKY